MKRTYLRGRTEHLLLHEAGRTETHEIDMTSRVFGKHCDLIVSDADEVGLIAIGSRATRAGTHPATEFQLRFQNVPEVLTRVRHLNCRQGAC